MCWGGGAWEVGLMIPTRLRSRVRNRHSKIKEMYAVTAL